MRLLLDSCVWGPAQHESEEARHDAVWTGEWNCDPGDEVNLARTIAEQPTQVTLDKDFGEFVIVHGAAHSGIVRLVGFPARCQASNCKQVLFRYEPKLLAGALITVDPGRVRPWDGG